MPVTASYTTIADSVIDTDSPLTEDLMTDMRDNIDYVKQVLEAHTHDGTYSDQSLPGLGGVSLTVGSWVGVAGIQTAYICDFMPECLLAAGISVVADTFLYSADGSKNINSDAVSATDSLVLGGLTLASAGAFHVLNEFYAGIAFKDKTSFVQYGTFAGDGAASQAITVGWEPDIVMVWDMGTTNQVCIRTPGHIGSNCTNMNSGLLQTATIISITTTGFKVGSNADGNRSGATIAYLALKESTGADTDGEKIKVVTHAGTGGDDLNVTGAGFNPQAILTVCTTTTNQVILAFARGGSENAITVQDSAHVTNRIQKFIADGVQVGTDADVNQASQSYDYIFFKGGTRPGS